MVPPPRCRAAPPPSTGRCRGCCCLPSPPPGAATPQHYSAYTAFGHKRCWGFLHFENRRCTGWCGGPTLPTTPHRAAFRRRQAHRSMRLARAQGCPAPQIGGHILALGTATWGWAGLGGCELGSRMGRPMCPVGGACIPTRHSAPVCPGPGPCGCLWVRGTAISLSSCRSFDRLG